MKPRIVILGAGFAGHTAALHLAHLVRGEADITVMAPGNRFTWFPSLIWVGTGTMSEDSVAFALAPVYQKIGVNYLDAKATTIDLETRQVTGQTRDGTTVNATYDYLVNATGPYLNFAATPGLGPASGNTLSVCSIEHAVATRDRYLSVVRDMEKGATRRLVIGVGHPAATCEGAAFEYLMNVDADLRRRGLRARADLVWLTNEPDLGDFGVSGIEAIKGGAFVTGAGLVRMIIDEAQVRPYVAAGVTKVEAGRIEFEQVGADPQAIEYDFAMLIPQFRGIPLTYIGPEGRDISSEMTNAGGFMRVDADYTAKSFEQYAAADWPGLYQSPLYANVYAAGIAFATPHPISQGKKTASGLMVVATAPRTGMASGIMGRVVAENIADQVHGLAPSHRMPMSRMPAACIASMGKSLWSGSAASIIMTPVVRDYATYPDYGRDLSLCEVDIGLSGAWTKRLLHSAFMWKLQARPGWHMIPE